MLWVYTVLKTSFSYVNIASYLKNEVVLMSAKYTSKKNKYPIPWLSIIPCFSLSTVYIVSEKIMILILLPVLCAYLTIFLQSLILSE